LFADRLTPLKSEVSPDRHIERNVPDLKIFCLVFRAYKKNAALHAQHTPGMLFSWAVQDIYITLHRNILYRTIFFRDIVDIQVYFFSNHQGHYDQDRFNKTELFLRPR
jgi:hypothetical protein